MMTMSEWNYNAAVSPGNMGFQDGLEEIGVNEVEDIFGDILSVATAPLKMVGQAVGGILGGGGGGGLPGLPGGLPGLPGLPGMGGGGGGGGPVSVVAAQPIGGCGGGGGAPPVVVPVQQGVGQALGMGPAGTPLGSLVGAGLGGVMPGTGPLPGALGQAAQSVYGQFGLPPAGIAAQAGADVYGPLARHTEQAGRAIVRRILGATTPQLRQLMQLINHRRNQIQATAEHNQLNAAQTFQNEVLGRLSGLTGAVAGPSRVRY